MLQSPQRHIAVGLLHTKLARQLLNQHDSCQTREGIMNNIVYIVGLVVIVLAVLGFFGLR